MTTKRSTTHGSTRKNKRMMSGGKGKISKYTQIFKKQYKRFIGINDADEKGKMEKMKIWGKMNGIFKFLQVQKEKYKGSEGTQVSGIEKMKENINAATNSSNKEGYIKAIDCLQNGDGTILSGTECVSYDKFVNGSDDDAAAVDEGAVEASNANAVTEISAPTADAAAPKEDDTPAPLDEEGDTPAPLEEEGVTTAADAPTAAVEGDSDEEDAPTPAPTAAPTPAPVDENKAVEGGGRSRRHTKPSRRIKSQKSKKGRMTRRKHRGGRR